MGNGRQYMFDDILKIDISSSQDLFSLALLGQLRKKSFHEITVKELCEEAGLSRKTYYKYFRDLHEVLDYTIENMNLGYYEFSYEVPEQISAVRKSFYHYFVYWYHLRDWVEVFVENDLWQYVTSRVNAQGIGLLSPRDWGDYLSGDEQTLSLAFEFVGAGCSRLVELWCLNGFDRSPMEMAELVEFIISGQMGKFSR